MTKTRRFAAFRRRGKKKALDVIASTPEFRRDNLTIS
jgi:hypothetical protein